MPNLRKNCHGKNKKERFFVYQRTYNRELEVWNLGLETCEMKHEALIGSAESGEKKKRMSAERRFSGWVHGLWKETRK